MGVRRTLVDIWPLFVQTLRHCLVRMRLDAEGLANREDLEEEGEVALRSALVFEPLGDAHADQVRMGGEVL